MLNISNVDRKSARLNSTQIEEIAVNVRVGLVSMDDFYVVVRDSEWHRFRAEARSTFIADDVAQALFDDCFLTTINEFQTTFIGLLRIGLSNRLKNAIRSEVRQRRTEQEHVDKYLSFTSNPMLLRDHEVEFEDYLRQLDLVLQQACQLLDDGFTMKAVSKQLGFKDQRTLQARLRKAFAAFVDQREAI